MANKWNEETTLKFVELYKRHECLWNVKAAAYKNREAREIAYASLAHAMDLPNFDMVDVITKIKNLRSTYSQEVNKINASIKRDSLNVYVPQMKWFALMNAFLQKFDSQPAITNQTLASIKLQEEIVNNDISGAHADLSLNSGVNHLHMGGNNLLQNSGGRIVTFRNRLRRKRRKFDVKPVESEPEIKTLITNSSGENEFEIFGKYVAIQLQRLAPENSLMAQDHIHSILNRLRLEEIRSSNGGISESADSSAQSPEYLDISIAPAFTQHMTTHDNET